MSKTRSAKISKSPDSSLVLVGIIIIGFLILFNLFTSLGQNLANTASPPSPLRGFSALKDDPVFSPLSSIASGARVIYQDRADSRQDSSDDAISLSPWWITGDQIRVREVEQEGGSDPSASGGIADLRPRLLSRSDGPINLKEAITIGLADLLNTIRRGSDKDPASANPFEDALKEVSNDSASKNPKNTADASSAKPDSSNEQNATKSVAAAQPQWSFLIVGNFQGQPVATAYAVPKSDLAHMTPGAPFVFDLGDLGLQSYNLDIILRSQANQESIAFGDLNNDSIPDLVITNKSTNDAAVYINDGQGHYIHADDIYGEGPAAAAIADFSGDGSPDIAVALEPARELILDGKGLRKFIFVPTTFLNEDCYSLLPYDFSGDGLPDLLITNYHDLSVSAYVNQGNGQFAASNAFPSQSVPTLQAKLDLNGDSIDDLVYVQYLGDHVSIVMLDGKDGSITNLGTMVIDPRYYYIVGDFNQDGVVDIAIATRP